VSAYKEIKVAFKNIKSIVKAIKELGWEVEWASSPTSNELHLYGYRGKKRPEKVVCRVDRQYVNKHWSGGSSNDVGIAYDPKTKEYKLIVSEYDQSRSGVMKAIKNLKQRYSVNEVKAKAMKKGYRIKEALAPDGKTRVLELVKG
jgi:hypothetical protein